MAPSRRPSRSYRSELRAKHAAATHTAIVVELAAELARSQETGSELSLARVAAAAGVSLRTVYHYFPDRVAQLAAVAARLDATTSSEPHPTSLGDLPAHAARFAHHALANPARLRTELALNRQRRTRDAAIQRAVAKQTDAATAKLAGAALATLLSPELALALLDRHRLDPAAAEITITWLVQVVVDAIKNGDAPSASFKRTRR